MRKFVYRFKISFLATFLVALSIVGWSQELPQIQLIQPSEAGIKWLIPASGTKSYYISWTDNFISPVRVILQKCDVDGNVLPTAASLLLADEDITWMELSTPCTYTNTTTYVSGGATGSVLVWNISNTWVVDHPNFGAAKYRILVRSVKIGGLAEEPASKSQSENYFELVTTLGGEIKVIQPDIADIRIPKNVASYWISWTDNLAENVDIYLTNTDGTTTPTVEVNIASNRSGSTYTWPVATWFAANAGTVTTTVDYWIKVRSSGGETIRDFSDNPFQFVKTLGGTFTFIQPYGGEQWRVGTDHLISWTDDLEEFVKLTLVKVDAPGAGDKDFYTTTHKWASTKKWRMPETAGTYKFRIESTEDGSINAESEHFQVVENLGSDITVIQPYGGEVWLEGTTHLISWTDNLTEDVQIWLAQEDGTPLQMLYNNVVGSTKSWVNMSGGFGPAVGPGHYKIIVKSTLYATQGISENSFEVVNSLGGEIIMIQPNVSGIAWALGSTHLISWTDNFPGGERIGIDLIKGSGGGTQTWTVSTDVPGTNPTTFSWKIEPILGQPAIPFGSDYRIRVYRVNPSVIATISEEYFSLWEPLDKLVVYPNPCNESTAVQFADEGDASYTLNLYDRFGTLVLQKSINTSDSKEVILPTSTLPNGIYFLNTTSKDSQTVKSSKIVIQH